MIRTKKSLNTRFDGKKRVRADAPKYGCVIADDVDFGEGVIVCDGYIRPTIIEEGVFMGHLCVIGHDAHIERGVVLGAGVKVSGEVHIKKYTFVGAGSVIQPKKTIGVCSMIGTLSNVTEDIPDFVIAYGNPCKVVRENKWKHPELE